MKSNWPTKKQYEECMDYKIREIINRNGEEFYTKYFKKHRDDWNVLCASMDTLGDTSLAISNFMEVGLGQTVGEKYLKLYGLLQAVFLQQDAVKSLFDVVKKSFNHKGKEKSLSDYERNNWETLRSYRNLTSGHPIANTSFKKGKTKRVLISRVTISTDGFQLLICDANNDGLKFEDIQLKDLLKGYLIEAEIILTDIENFLNDYEL